MHLARESYPYLVVGMVVAGAGALLGFPFISGGAVALTGFVAFFFRDPDRAIPSEAGIIVSPGDGRVVEVLQLPGAKGTRVSIFLSLMDVHITRAPAAGSIRSVDYHPGRFLPANLKRAALENERNDLTLDTTMGEVRLSQIAGLVARRIVCRKQAGDSVSAGERIGLIQFGSRLEVVFPAGFRPVVSTGARVKGGCSILARGPERLIHDEEKEFAQANAG